MSLGKRDKKSSPLRFFEIISSKSIFKVEVISDLKLHVGDDKKYVSLADAIRTACRRLLDQLDEIDERHGRIKRK